jgi:hypothetical protein
LVDRKSVDLDVVADRLGPHVISNWRKAVAVDNGVEEGEEGRGFWGAF